MKDLIVYTDGAYSPTTDRGGAAFVAVVDDEVVYKANKSFIGMNQTNQRMEMSAVILALCYIKPRKDYKIIIHSDSAYVVNTMTKGWRKKANNDLWDVLDKLMIKHNFNVDYTWVKGHSVNKFNNIVDKLAVDAKDG